MFLYLPSPKKSYFCKLIKKHVHILQDNYNKDKYKRLGLKLCQKSFKKCLTCQLFSTLLTPKSNFYDSLGTFNYTNFSAKENLTTNLRDINFAVLVSVEHSYHIYLSRDKDMNCKVEHLVDIQHIFTNLFKSSVHCNIL